VHLIGELEPSVDDAVARALVHASIAAIQSALFHNLGLPKGELRPLLKTCGLAVLRVAQSDYAR